MRASVALPASAGAATALIGRGADLATRKRWWIVAGCALAQWAVLALRLRHGLGHNGWLFPDGDDGPWYWTTAWGLTSLHVPYTAIGPGWPYLMTPLAAIFGPNMADGAPAVIALNVLVLAPLSVVGMYLLAERIAGRLFGLWAAALWVVLPVVATALYDAGHRKYLVSFFLPTATGLNMLSDYPSMVCAIFCAYLVLRARDTNRWSDGALAGVLLGFLVMLKPANGALPVVAVLLLAVSLRFRALLGAVAAAIPAVIALAIWKQTGTGAVPAFSGGGGGGGGGGGASPAPAATKYLHFDAHHLGQNVHALGQVFWSVRLLELLLLAGSFGLIARARWRGALVVAWFLGFGLVKGTVYYSNVYDTSLYRFLLPAWPAWVLIVAGVVFCWPAGSIRRAHRPSADLLRRTAAKPAHLGVVAAATAVFAVLPFLLIASASAGAPGAFVDENYVGAPIPVVDFGARAHRTGPAVVGFTWSPRTTRRAATAYAIFKARDDGCGALDPSHPLCRFKMQLIGTSRTPQFTDTQASGAFVYRIALVDGSTVQVDNPSLLLVSKPLRVPAR